MKKASNKLEKYTSLGSRSILQYYNNGADSTDKKFSSATKLHPGKLKTSNNNQEELLR